MSRTRHGKANPLSGLEPFLTHTRCFAAALGLICGAYGQDWPQWRGPFFNGSSAETNLSIHWGKTNGAAWVTPLPGRSGATPIVWKDRVFVASPDNARNLVLVCIEKSSGKVLWQKQAGSGDRTLGRNNMASCSPVTDGQRVFALFGTGDLGAFDFAGNQLWRRQLTEEFGVFALQFLYGASPLMLDGKLYVPILQRNPPTYQHARDDRPERKSYLVCLDPATGKTLWRHQRVTDADGERMEAYTTPVPYWGTDGAEIILVGGDCVTAHQPATGQELWRYTGMNPRQIAGGRIVPSAVTAPGFIFACGPKREIMVAVKHGLRGTLGDEQVAWKRDRNVPDVCTPLYYLNKLFVLDGDRQVLTCLNPPDGGLVWEGRLPLREVLSASPTGADGKIFCVGEEGTVAILSAGDRFEIMATIPLGEGPCRSSIVVSDRRLLVRTAENLYCF